MEDKKHKCAMQATEFKELQGNRGQEEAFSSTYVNQWLKGIQSQRENILYCKFFQCHQMHLLESL